MARVRVIVYREGSDEILEDFVCEDPDKNSYRVAEAVVGSIGDDIWKGYTEELVSNGESV